MRGIFLLVAIMGGMILLSPFQLSGQDKKSKEKFKITKVEKKILDLTNRERKKANLPPLKPNPLLFKVAREHSKNMAKKRKLDHFLDGVSPFQRLKKAGYRYYHSGENIGYGNAAWTPDKIMDGWMKSEYHRKNILHKRYKEIGIGQGTTEDGISYYTQVFGLPK